MNKQKIILSGVQPTGVIHLGNYLGAIRNWVAMQNESKHLSILGVMDMHSITVQYNPSELKQNILNSVVTYIACGIDPSKSFIFQQSAIHQHAELAWILACNTPMGMLKRMTQFKDKAGNSQDEAYSGLFFYPILMAADILIYNANFVPVGNDQKQHLELARDIAGMFNNKFGAFFTLPESIFYQNAERIMSLRDGLKKMSKSDDSEMSRINLTDGNDEIAKKIQKSKTDSIREVYFDKENRPEVSNLLNIYKVLGGDIDELTGKETSHFKKQLVEVLINVISPIREKIFELKNNQDYIKTVLKSGNEKASAIAEKNLCKIKELIGFN